MQRWKRLQKQLVKKDVRFSLLFKEHGDCLLQPAQMKSFFSVLCSSIISQQLSTKAADAIEKRFSEKFGTEVEQEIVLQTTDEELRALGLSLRKATYLKDLAHKFISGDITNDYLANESDENIIEKLTEVKGIGLWTAQMFLIFALNRPDIWAAGDLGLRKAVMKLNGFAELPTEKEMVSLADAWSPCRTVASWYLWRSLG